MNLRKRRASRLIVVDREGRILLFQYEDGRGKWWATPGGGVQAQETFEEAAAREAKEELGLTAPSLEPLWERFIQFESRGAVIRQTERYFLIRATTEDVRLGDDVRQAHKVEGIVAARWWLPEEIGTTNERVFPEDLVTRCAGALLRGSRNSLADAVDRQRANLADPDSGDDRKDEGPLVTRGGSRPADG